MQAPRMVGYSTKHSIMWQSWRSPQFFKNDERTTQFICRDLYLLTIRDIILAGMDSEDASLLQEKTREQRVTIENLEKELTRLKHKEQLVNEYAGSMHDKLQQKDEVIATKERRIEFLEGEVLHLQDTLAGAREAMRIAPVLPDNGPIVTTGIKEDYATTPSTEDSVHQHENNVTGAVDSSNSSKIRSATAVTGSSSSGGKSMMARLRGCMPTVPTAPSLPKSLHLYVGGLIAIVAVVAVVVNVVGQMGGGGDGSGGGFGDEEDMGF